MMHWYMLLIFLLDGYKSDGLDPKVKVYQWKDKTFQVLHQIKENSKTLGVFAFLNLGIGTDFRSLETHFSAPYTNY